MPTSWVTALALTLILLTTTTRLTTAQNETNTTTTSSSSNDTSTGSNQPPPNKRYSVTTYGNLTCSASGYTCRYVSFDYANITLSKGARTSLALDNNVEYTVFTPDQSSADGLPITAISVLLQDCNRTDGEDCVAECTFGCECRDESNNECTDLGTLPPSTTSAPTSATTDDVCLVQNQTQLCSQMIGKVPPNGIDLMDCFNFCGGEFVGACSFGEECRETAYLCNTTTPANQGTTLGVISGCTKELLTGKGKASKSTKLLVQSTDILFTVLWSLMASLSLLI